MSKPIQSATVYLGSSGHARRIFYDEAYRLGKKMAGENIRLIFGGMNAGAMRTLSHGVLENGGEVTGVIPTRIRDSERVSRDLSELLDVETMWQRKKMMFELGDMLIMLPGGYGTLDEGLEAVYWKMLGLHDKPVVFINIDGYYSPLRDFFERQVKDGNIEESVLDMVTFLESLDEFDFADYDCHFSYSVDDDFPHFEDEIFEATRTPIIVDTPDVPQTYKLMTALVTKQLGAHTRPIGLLNKDHQFDDLVKWVEIAARESFITKDCPRLMTVCNTEKGLMEALESSEEIIIDLHRDKWGE